MEPKKEMSESQTANGPKRFLVFDNLIVDIVDEDENGAPIVEFSMCPNEEVASKLPVECGICPDVMHRTRLDKHIEKHIRYVDGVKRFACICCDDHFATRAFAAGHLRRHEGIRPYVCEECKIYYCTKEDLKMHQRRRHWAKDHICEICGKTFTQNSILRNHILSAHEQQKRFSCEHCGKKFLRRYAMSEHIRNIHLLSRRLLRCKFCEKVFADTHKLAQHRKEEHLNQSSFECRDCNVQFNSIEFFNAHKRSIQCRKKYSKNVQTLEESTEKVEQDAGISHMAVDRQVGLIEIREGQDILSDGQILTLHDNGHVLVEGENEILYEIAVEELTGI